MPSPFHPSTLERFGFRMDSQTGGEVTVLAHDKSDFAFIPTLRQSLPGAIRIVRTDLSAFQNHTKREEIAPPSSSEKTESPTPPRGGNGTSAIAKLNELIGTCLDMRASDIHIEPRESSLLCRARIDGALAVIEELPKERLAEILSRLKILSGLDIAEKRRPQDGRIRYEHRGRTVDIRVSIIPTGYGQKAVLRLLDASDLRLSLDAIGFTTEEADIFREKISLPNGIVLVTGPTGSGKTTTLYAALSHLKSDELNISTVEDPIEYNLNGINQTQAKPEIGVTFAHMLRALLRQDPNVIMVGEIRDSETLDMAIRASLTGHLVFSTLHTNDAPSTITRLLNMGADPIVLASTLKLVVAQRLVRTICNDCVFRDLDEANVSAAHRLGLGDRVREMRMGSGCETCNHTGYYGRVPVFEMLPIDGSVAEAICSASPESSIRGLSGNRKLGSLHENAVNLVAAGQTTPSEVLREVHI